MKTALVTGSSRGIGRAIALRLAKDGFRVILHGVRPSEKLDAAKREIEETGGTAVTEHADLTDPTETAALAARLGGVDVLVLNASVQYRTPWREITVEAAHAQLSCNFVSSLLLIQALTPHMQETGWGRVITIGSVQEAKPHPDMLVYSSSKSLALQLAGSGITVNNVAPGVIYTDRNVEALSDPVYAEKVRASIPVGFYGEPDDCAGIVSLLASEEGRYITGQSIFVDGGKSIQ